MRSFLRPRFAFFSFQLVIASTALVSLGAEDAPPVGVGPAAAALPRPPSEDSLIPNFYSMGEIAGRTNIFRCAGPVDKIASRLKGAEPSEADRAEAKAQMQHLYDLGVRTVVSLQRQEPPSATGKNPEYPAVLLEKTTAEEVGLNYIGYSIANSGKGDNSLQYMPDDEAYKLIDAISADIVKRSETGGVVFHCKSGVDRTGLVAGYLRVKYQKRNLDDALVEMRQKGHVWKKFLKPDNTYSWHENHLRTMVRNITPAE